jgi:hypothetical protein
LQKCVLTACAGLIALAGGLAPYSLRGHAPAYVPHIFGTGLVVLALTLAQSGAMTVLDHRARDMGGWLLLGVIVAALAALEAMHRNAWLHALVATGVIGLLSLRVAYAFDRCRGMRGGRPLRALACLFGTFGLLMMLDAALTAVAVDPGPSAGPGTADALMRVGLLAGLLLGTMLLLWVMNERFHHRMQRLASLDALTGTLIRPVFV